MQPTPNLSPQAEKAWLELRHHVDWSTDFALIFLFSSSAYTVDTLRKRLENLAKSKVSALQVITPSSPQLSSPGGDGDLPEAFRCSRAYASPPVVGAHRDDSDGLWEAARDNVLMRLNEHRDLIRDRIRRPSSSCFLRITVKDFELRRTYGLCAF